MTAAKKREDLTKAVLLWVYEQVLDHGCIATPLDQDDTMKMERARKTAYSELKRLGLIDEIGTPTKEGRRMLGLI